MQHPARRVPMAARASAFAARHAPKAKPAGRCPAGFDHWSG